MKKRKPIKNKLSKKFIFVIIILTLLIGVGIGVYAFGTSTPSTFGHSLGEIALPSCSEGQTLGITNGAWSCISSLNFKVVQIGDWNMDTSLSKNVNLGIDKSRIKIVTVLIVDDNNAQINNLLTDTWRPSVGGYYKLSGNNILLERLAGTDYDTSSYDQTGYNRGWVTIGYN